MQSHRRRRDYCWLSLVGLFPRKAGSIVQCACIVVEVSAGVAKEIFRRSTPWFTPDKLQSFRQSLIMPNLTMIYKSLGNNFKSYFGS